MKIKTNSPMVDENDQVIKRGDKVYTFRDVAINSVLTPIQTDDEKAKVDKYEIYKKLKNAGAEVELKVEELSLLKKAIGKIQPQLLMGQCFEIIEGK